MGSGKRRALPVVDPWKEKAMAALKDSIAHWERMRDDLECEEGPYAEDCACCEHFMVSSLAGPGCLGCPVSARTRRHNCGGTPWARASGAWERCRRIGSLREEFEEEAGRMIDFLRETLRMVEAGEVKP